MGLIMSKDVRMSIMAHILDDTSITVETGTNKDSCSYSVLDIGDCRVTSATVNIFIKNSRIPEIIELLKEQLSTNGDKDE